MQCWAHIPTLVSSILTPATKIKQGEIMYFDKYTIAGLNIYQKSLYTKKYMICIELCLSHPCVEVSVYEIDGAGLYQDKKIWSKCLMSKRFERYDNV